MSPTPVNIAGITIQVPDQGDIAWRDDYIDHFEAVGLSITTTSGELQTQIDAIVDDVDDINGLTGSVTVTGSSNFPIRTEGQVITVSGADFIDNLENAYDGGVLATDNTYTVTSDGATITFTLDRAGGASSVEVQISGSDITHPMPDTVTLTAAGTDTNPQENWVFLLESAGALTLTSNTSGFPAAAHARVARAIVQTAPGVAASGVLKLHAYTDHVLEPMSRGSIGHIHAVNERIRSQFAEWDSGTLLTTTVDTGPTPDNVSVQVSAGVVFQLHTHATPALDTSGSDLIFLLNDFTEPYKTIQSLSEITEYNDGSAIGPSERFNVIVWGSVAENDSDTKLFLNLPPTGYNNDTNASNDVDNTAIFTIPREYAGVGWLLARLTLKRAGGGNTWTVINNLDLRGATPSSFPGGIVIGGAGITDHGLLTGLPDDDHTQYVLEDGTRGFSATVSGVDPVDSDDLATKSYVDTQDVSISGHLQNQVSQLGSVILSFPAPGDKVMLFYVDGDQGDVDFDRMTVLVTGTSTPVVDWNVHAGATFGTETEDVFTVDKITSNTTIGETITSFDSPTIGGSVDRWCWLEVVNTSGTVEAFNFSAWQTSNIV